MANTLFRMLDQRRILLDARFLGRGGAGRATSLLLRGLKCLRPPGHWVIWGPRAAQEFLWKEASWHLGGDPTSLFGQRELLQRPQHDVAIYMHQIRPLRRGPSVTLIHDTIPLRHGSTPPARLLKRSYFRKVAALSDRIVTVSDFSKKSIAHDLGVPDSRIRVVRYPIDSEVARRVSDARRSLPPEQLVLFVGRFAPHKNLERLLLAFNRTEFRRKGGRLLLVGGTSKEATSLWRLTQDAESVAVEIRSSCSQTELESLYARAALLVMPSLEEGFGLPVWEAMSFGLPVAVSDGGALPEVVGGRTRPFPATSVNEMATAIDHNLKEETLPFSSGPTVEEFASEFVVAAEEAALQAIR